MSWKNARIENLELMHGHFHHKEHNQGYQSGFKKGFTDGRSQKIKQLEQRIRELEGG